MLLKIKGKGIVATDADNAIQASHAEGVITVIVVHAMLEGKLDNFGNGITVAEKKVLYMFVHQGSLYDKF